MFNKTKASFLFNQTSYITSETYHALNRNSSDKYIIRSTSTLFYDLDTLAKRHSYHFVPEYPIVDRKMSKQNIEISHKNGFGAKSETIVQECATQIKPKLKRLDSLNIAKKMKKRSLDESMLSSEIFLRDNDYTKRKSDSFVQDKSDLRQKFWSYAKYKTQYTNPKPEMKKCKKKDRGKRTEDPCPCQLFSYACPCTDKKSLTKLANSSKSLTVADQITSTPDNLPEEDNNQNYSKIKKSKCSVYCEDKPTNTKVTEFTKPNEMTAVYEEPVTYEKDMSQFIDDKPQRCTMCVKNGTIMKTRAHKKSKQVICPNCKETLEILSTEDEDSLSSHKSPHKDNTPSPPEYQNNKGNNMGETDICIHNPPCELVPVCQILPTDNVYNNMNTKCVRRVSLTKHNPKTIRITKGCRHHPPCTVVPSCQRLNVLKNNCEYIPPCLHRPHCINVPLCVPFSKNLNYEDILNKKIYDDTDLNESNNCHSSKLMSGFHKGYLNNYTNHTCEYLSELSSRFILNTQMPGLPPTISPFHEPNQLPCKCCKSHKSCQYDCVDCKCTPREVKECTSSDDIIYIRDVGCQFRSENFGPKDSLPNSKTSSASFDLTSTKTENYYNNYHTLRYEDKFTNPISGEEVSLLTFMTSSMEIDAQCPAHGIQAVRKRTTGFNPQSTASPFVAAFSTYKDPILQYRPVSELLSRVTSKSDSIDTLTYLTTFPVKSRRNILKGKHKKVISVKRRNKSKQNCTWNCSRINNI